MAKVDADELRRLIDARTPSAKIRSRFGISHATLAYWRNKLGVPAELWRKCDPERVRQLVADGLTDRQIADAIGVGVDRVADIRHRLGLKHNNGRGSAEYKAARAEAMRRRNAAGDIQDARRRAYAAARASLAGRYNLPADLLPVQVQIVVALSAGPMQLNELADRLNRGPARHGHARFAYPRAPGGNLLVGLRARGLIFSTRTRRGAVYFLTPHCIDLLAGAANGHGTDGDGAGAGGQEAGRAAETASRG